MTVARLCAVIHNAERPRWSGAGTVTVWTRQGAAALDLATPVLAASEPNGKGRLMTQTNRVRYHRSRPEGAAHRARIRAFLLPRLTVGCRLPRAALLARWLGCCQQQAQYHLRRVLDEDGIGTSCRGNGAGGRLYVTALPEREQAA